MTELMLEKGLSMANMEFKTLPLGSGYARVETTDGRLLGIVQRDSVAEQVRPGVVREREGWAAITPSQQALADPVRQAGAPVFDTRREAATWLAGRRGGVMYR